VRSDIRSVGWWVLVGAGSGAIAGFVVGGVGGRLAMLLLRLTSPDFVVGMISDDGFEIGVFTARTLQLALGMAMLGSINGVLYAALRGAIPRRLRLPAWTLFAAALGGATVVHEDGVDFTLLEPAALAVALFVALPALAAAVVVVLVERWSRRVPWADRRLATLLAVAAVGGTFGLFFAVPVGAGALLLRRAGLDGLVRSAGRVVVPAGLVAVTVVAALQLVSESARIID
jgi:hypothetical protein